MALYDSGASTGYQIVAGSDGALEFKSGDESSNGTERLRFDANGNIGIGTNSPDAMLDINGTLKLAGTGSEPCSATEEGSQRYNC